MTKTYSEFEKASMEEDYRIIVPFLVYSNNPAILNQLVLAAYEGDMAYDIGMERIQEIFEYTKTPQLETKKCPWCLKQFTPTGKNQKYCSASCRRKSKYHG